MTEVSVTYERKFSDGNYGSEGLSMSWAVTYDDDSDLAADPEVVAGRCAVIESAVRAAVLGQLAKSEARNVALAAQRELNPPPPPRPREAVATGGPPEDLEDIPF